MQQDKESNNNSLAFGIFVLLSALTISATAGFYSIVGLMAIFSGASLAVAIMGGSLEVGKLVAASWLHKNWSSTGWLMKSYLTLAVLVLMFITSMGIFGFLSKAHLEQVGPRGNFEAELEKIEFDITQQQQRIDRANEILGQFDKALEVYFQKEFVTRGLKERAKQKDEREALQQEIKEAQNSIDELNAQKFEAKKEVLGIEAEVGPIKYIADFVFNETSDKSLDKAVQWIIILLIFVFDPVAVVLVLAANISIKSALERRQKNKRTKEMEKALDEVISYVKNEESSKAEKEELTDVVDNPHTRETVPGPELLVQVQSEEDDEYPIDVEIELPEESEIDRKIRERVDKIMKKQENERRRLRQTEKTITFEIPQEEERQSLTRQQIMDAIEEGFNQMGGHSPLNIKEADKYSLKKNIAKIIKKNMDNLDGS